MMDSIDRTTGEIVRGGPMPPAIAAAIIAVKKQIRQLGADDKNQHGGYAFVSVDKFYERVGPLMAQAGLALLIDETESRIETGKSGNPWLFVSFALAFIHESGAVSAPLRRSCALPISGPQAYGAAQSYIEKQFLRQVFKIPTGDKDADATAPTEGEAPAAPPPRSPPPRRQTAAEPSAARDEARKRWGEIRDEIQAAMSEADVRSIEGCMAWESLAKALHAAEEPAVAEEALQKLRLMIEKRVARIAEGEAP